MERKLKKHSGLRGYLSELRGAEKINIQCLNCGNEIAYYDLSNGYDDVYCPQCKFINRILIKEEKDKYRVELLRVYQVEEVNNG